MSASQQRPFTAAPEPIHRLKGHGGVTLAADTWGEPGSPLVVLLHGGGQTRHAWKQTGSTLAARGYYVIAYDARGHGDSDWAPDGEYGLDAVVADLQCIIRHVGGGPAALVGASMGGGTSLVAIGEGRVEASALILVDVAPRIEHDGVARIRAFMNQRPGGFDNLDEVADAIAAYQPHRGRPRRLEGLGKNVRLGADGKYHWHWDPKIASDQSDLEDYRARLERSAVLISVPCLLVRGGMSDVLTEEGAREFLALAPGSQYVNVADAAHIGAGDRNDLFGTAIVEFLGRFVLPSGES